jgi:hypothetical protein
MFLLRCDIFTYYNDMCEIKAILSMSVVCVEICMPSMSLHPVILLDRRMRLTRVLYGN